MSAFTPSFSLVTGPGAAPRALCLVLHGIYGSGGNWRSVARKLVAARPEWGFVLVDLREHGRSKGAPPPHRVDTAAAELSRVVAEVEAQAPVRAVIGHSFGGKVASVFRAQAARPPAQTWIIDSTPSARPEALDGGSDVVHVLELLESLPSRYASRDEFVAAATDAGLSTPVAQWLAMNVERVDGEFLLTLDLMAMRALLTDYFARDAWPELEDPTRGGPLHVVIGERSSALSPEDRARLDRLASSSAGRISVHRLDAGHWVHVDALDPLVALIADALPGAANVA